jgi:hypothetical protein
MAYTIQYNSITYSATEPTNPQNYDWWIKTIGATYQVYIYAGALWQPFIGGGSYIAETNPDVHYINTVISDTEPDSVIKMGWLWVNEAINQMSVYLGEYLFIFGW